MEPTVSKFKKRARLFECEKIDEFLRFLDQSFKSEIKLNENEEQLFVNKSSDSSKNDNIFAEEVNLAYRGQKHLHPKGIHSERKDVLYKSFIRAVRRYLWSMFVKEFDISKISLPKPSELYKQYVKEFYQKHLKEYASQSIKESWNKEDSIWLVLGVVLSKTYTFPNKTGKWRNLIKIFESVHHAFSIVNFKKLMKIEYVSELFKIINDSGIAEKTINAYPKLSVLKDSYLRVSKCIVEFNEKTELS